MIQQALEYVRMFNIDTARLKANSSYYPNVYSEYINGEQYYSTLVRIKRDEKWYVVHCIETINTASPDWEKYLFMRLMSSVHNIQNLYKINLKHADIDKSQQEECDRLRSLLS
jgi:hypothetical protein